jgi:Uroporphyrinogen decarboxylase (URO-D)
MPARLGSLTKAWWAFLGLTTGPIMVSAHDPPPVTSRTADPGPRPSPAEGRASIIQAGAGRDFRELIGRLVEASITYLVRQFERGIEAAQIFESWALAIPEPFLEEWSLDPIRCIVAGVRGRIKAARFIVFARGCGLAPPVIAKITGAECIGLDWRLDPASLDSLIAAGYLADWLDAQGFVVLKKPSNGGHSLNSWMPPKEARCYWMSARHTLSTRPAKANKASLANAKANVMVIRRIGWSLIFFRKWVLG